MPTEDLNEVLESLTPFTLACIYRAMLENVFELVDQGDSEGDELRAEVMDAFVRSLLRPVSPEMLIPRLTPPSPLVQELIDSTLAHAPLLVGFEYGIQSLVENAAMMKPVRGGDKPPMQVAVGVGGWMAGILAMGDLTSEMAKPGMDPTPDWYFERGLEAMAWVFSASER